MQNLSASNRCEMGEMVNRIGQDLKRIGGWQAFLLSYCMFSAIHPYPLFEFCVFIQNLPILYWFSHCVWYKEIICFKQHRNLASVKCHEP